jgi:mannosyltransferase OCH1-like enzyme
MRRVFWNVFKLVLFLLLCHFLAFVLLRAEPDLESQATGAGAISMKTERIPLHLYQTYKTSNIWEMDSDRQLWVKSWMKVNSNLSHSVFNNKDLNNFMVQHFQNAHGDKESELIWRAYQKLPFLVQKTDLWRYLIIFKKGGIYSDVDVECRASFDKWYGPHDPSSVKFILGLEVSSL